MDNQQQDSANRAKAEQLLANEAQAVESFLKVVNDVIRGNGSVNPMSEKTALKFLISRKFDIQKAVQLYQMHEVTRLREGLTIIDPDDVNFKAELNSGKFTLLKHRDPNNSAIALFTAKLHTPNKSSKNQALKRKIHRTTLQGIVYQLDSALEDVMTQRNGIVFIYNMSNSEYSNFDYELCQKILNLLKGAYPAKLKKVLIVSPPLWFKAPFHLLRLIVREKLRDRVWLLNIEQLSDHIPSQALTPELGGSYIHDHHAWIDECNTLYKTRFDDLCDPTSAQALSKTFNNKSTSLAGGVSNLNYKRASQDVTSSSSIITTNDDNFNFDICSQINNNNNDSKTKIGRKQNKLSIYDYDDSGVSLIQFIDIIKDKGKKGLGDEYETIVCTEKTGTFAVSSSPLNMCKNRYINIKCYDNTRVVLESYDLPPATNPEDPMDYINASYIDGYRQSKAYVSTQGPTERTLMDFWRMIWQTNCRVIVMVTLNVENLVMKCDRYWPFYSDCPLTTGIYTIELLNSETQEDYVITQLKLTNTQTDISRIIWHLQFTSWPDFGTPQTASALLKYRECVLKKQLDAIELTGNSNYPPIVVHCSAGVGRTGTFITIDICIQKLETTGLVDVKSVVEKLRQQRYSSIQTKEQYIFCYKAVVEYAASCGLLSEEDLDDIF